MGRLISIIIPVYDVEKYLTKCIDSVSNQTYKNIEIILVNDGSPDKCPQICDEYAKKDFRIKVIHKKNSGLSDARNTGLDMATGEYIMFIDSDDYIEKAMVETLYQRLIKDQSDLAICNFKYVEEDGNSIVERNISMPIKDECIDKYKVLKKMCGDYYWYYVTAVNKLYKSEIFNNIRFPLGKLHEDEFTAHHIFDQCEKISCVSTPLYNYVQRENSIMAKEFSIKRLDGAEAFFERTNFFIEKKMYREASIAYSQGLGVLTLGYKHLDKTAEKRLKELKKKYDGIFPEIIDKNVLLKRKIGFSIFRISPKSYQVLQFFKHKGDKSEKKN